MNSNFTPAIVLTALAALIIPFQVEAQNPQAQILNLANVRLNTISGEITQLFSDKFILNDGQRQIIVEVEPSLGQSITLSVGERVTVFGKYDDDDFEAFTITRANGETIKIHDD